MGIKSELENTLLLLLTDAGISEPLRDHQFALGMGRKWELDFFWAEPRVAVEVQGGIWLQTWSGRSKGHAHPRRVEEDCAKSNEAQLMGIIVIKVCKVHIEDGRAVLWIGNALAMRGGS